MSVATPETRDPKRGGRQPAYAHDWLVDLLVMHRRPGWSPQRRADQLEQLAGCVGNSPDLVTAYREAAERLREMASEK